MNDSSNNAVLSSLRGLLTALRFSLAEAKGSWIILISFASAILIGIAAMSFARSINTILRKSVDLESKQLLGADIMLSSRDPLSSELVSRVQALTEAVSSEVRFRTMISTTTNQEAKPITPSNNVVGLNAFLKQNTSLAIVRVLEGDFPYYGQIETLPKGAWQLVKEANSPLILVDESLAKKLFISTGDTVSIAGYSARVAGIVIDIPGDVSPMYAFAPRIFTASRHLPQEALLTRGSIADYYLYAKFGSQESETHFISELAEILKAEQVEITTVANTQEFLGEISQHLSSFFGLIGVVALFLGGLAALTTLGFYLRRKRQTVAILKCLGASSWFVKYSFALQVACAALTSSLLGSIIGVSLAWVIPIWLESYLPFRILTSFRWEEILTGTLIGTVSLMLVLAPNFRELTKSSPAQVLRFSESATTSQLSSFSVLQLLLIVLLSIIATGELTLGMLAALGILSTVFALFCMALLLKFLTKKLNSKKLPFSLRYALSSLNRPGNQTALLTISFGLGITLLVLVLISHHLLLSKTNAAKDGQRASAFVVDIGPEQRESLRSLISPLPITVTQEAPIVLMRLSKVEGKGVDELLSDSTSRRTRSTLNREYWSTYRSNILESERVVQGNWFAEPLADPSLLPVSIEKKFMERIGASFGDSLELQVAGIPIKAQITSIREVIWERVERNSFLVFPEGSLSHLPHFFVFGVVTPSAEVTAQLMNLLSHEFPDVSVFDVRSIVSTIEKLLSYISWILSGLAGLILVVSFISLISILIMSRFEKVREVALLKTLGGTSYLIRKVVVIEYVLMALIAAALGTACAVIISLPLSQHVFRSPLSVPVTQVIGVSALLVIVVFCSVLNAARSWSQTSPSVLLRAE